MSSESAWGPFGLLMCCFPQKESSKPSSPQYRSDRYNAHVRSNLNLPTQRPKPQQPQPLLLASSSTQQQQQQVKDTDKPGPPGTPSAAAPPRLKPSKRLPAPVAVASDPRTRWASTYLTSPQLGELFDALHATLKHIPYAICGLSALVDHGLRARRAATVSILCPAHCKDNVKSWARARGFDTWADSVGVPIGGESGGGGEIRRVRIKYVDQGFERLERVRAVSGAQGERAEGNAWVLGLSSELDHVAAAWLDVRKRATTTTTTNSSSTSDTDAKTSKAMKSIAHDIFWVLGRAIETRHALDAHFLPTFLGEEFWTAFGEANPETRTEAARAGVDVAAVLARHRADASLREHDAMLEAYGLRGDPVTTQPGPLEDMRCLAEKKSMYTLGNRDSQLLPGGSMALLPNSEPAAETETATGRKDGPKTVKHVNVKKSSSVRSSSSKGKNKRDLKRSKSERK
ncbi:hypothetical protein F5B20DRAFT_588165 [Whalleya microplaca]|nr:hypothetical protein F5B20DRAFT_588165 [Whalleya microplaca]